MPTHPHRPDWLVNLWLDVPPAQPRKRIPPPLRKLSYPQISMTTSYRIHLILKVEERPTKDERASMARFAIAANKLLAAPKSQAETTTHPKPN
jgi:hypothetical protein